MSLKNWVREHIVDTDPNPEGAHTVHPLLVDAQDEAKESGR